jgi:hypothetical protein
MTPLSLARNRWARWRAATLPCSGSRRPANTRGGIQFLLPAEFEDNRDFEADRFRSLSLGHPLLPPLFAFNP